MFVDATSNCGGKQVVQAIFAKARSILEAMKVTRVNNTDIANIVWLAICVDVPIQKKLAHPRGQLTLSV